MPKQFNFKKWLTAKCDQEPRIYKWDRAAKFVMAHIHDNAEEPLATFSTAWGFGNYDQPRDQSVGLLVLFEDRFWLVHSIHRDERQLLEFPASKIRKLKVLDPTDKTNWRMYNLELNDDWLRLAIWPPRDGGRDAYKEFVGYL